MSSLQSSDLLCRHVGIYRDARLVEERLVSYSEFGQLSKEAYLPQFFGTPELVGKTSDLPLKYYFLQIWGSHVNVNAFKIHSSVEGDRL